VQCATKQPDMGNNKVVRMILTARRAPGVQCSTWRSGIPGGRRSSNGSGSLPIAVGAPTLAEGPVCYASGRVLSKVSR